jgi:transcriptional regulator GlxA family with amidase domain
VRRFVAIDDSDVAAAMHLIHGRATTGLNVAGIVHEWTVSRCYFERRFRRVLNRSPGQ